MASGNDADRKLLSRGCLAVAAVVLAIVIGIVLLVAIPASFNKKDLDPPQDDPVPPIQAVETEEPPLQPAEPGGAAEVEPQPSPEEVRDQ